MRSAGDELARGAGVGLGDLAGEVRLRRGDRGQPLDLGGAGGLLIAVGDLDDGLLVGVEVGGAGRLAVLDSLLVELGDARGGGLDGVVVALGGGPVEVPLGLGLLC